MRSDTRNLLIIIYATVLVIILYFFISNSWSSWYKLADNDYSKTRYDSGIKRPPIKSVKTITTEVFPNRTVDEAIGELITELKVKDHNKYRIKTPGCKLRDLPLYDEETKDLFKEGNKKKTIWSCTPTTIHITRFNETWIKIDKSQLDYSPLCYYRSLKVGPLGDKDDFQYDGFRGPMKFVINFPDYEFVHILCYNRQIPVHLRKVYRNYSKLDSDIIHDEIIPLIPFVNKSSTSDVPNVLLLAIDATSYVNFKRHFIRTEKLLNKHNFFELRGYNKVGANTYPNMIPFFTGHHSNEIMPEEKLKEIYFDDWPIIWKKYSEKGFITAFLEEMSWCGLFHYLLWGFLKKPTDYQTRPFHMEIKPDKYWYYCYLDKTETERSLDWAIDFVRAMKKRQQKYFAYISISEMTHDWFEAGHYMDVPYHQLLTQLFDEKLLENTVVFLFSDHGFRYGKLRQTHTGEMESRLPFMYIHLPENIDPKYAENLRQNQYRLTTAFDIHATMTHLIEGQANQSLPHGISLFDRVIDEDRDCNTSSIPDSFCSCYEDIEVYDFYAIKPKESVDKIVDRINSFTEKFREKCAEYKFDSIHKLFNRSLTRDDSEFKLGDSLIYIIQVYVNPGMALFETALRSFEKNSRFEIIGDITRINLYGNQSHCLSDKILKNYCYCTDLL